MSGALQSSRVSSSASPSPTPSERVSRTLPPVLAASLPLPVQPATPSPRAPEPRRVSVAGAATPSDVRRSAAGGVPSSGTSSKRGRSVSPGATPKRRRYPVVVVPKKGSGKATPSKVGSGGRTQLPLQSSQPTASKKRKNRDLTYHLSRPSVVRLEAPIHQHGPLCTLVLF